MSKQLHPRVLHRMWVSYETGQRIMNRRFNKAINRSERKRTSEANMIVLTRRGWEKLSGSGLIHKGRKP